MPIYEYLCGACGHVLDALQKHSDEPLVHCPHCAAPQLKRQLSAPSFRLKGGGWYETDFKTDKDRKKRLADATEARPAADGAAADKDAGPSKAETTGKPEKAEKADKAAAADKPAKAGPARKKRGSGGRAAAAD